MISKIKKKYRVIFMGTPDFGLPSLKTLVKSELFDVVAVITQSDKKIGRKQTISVPPIKKEAEKHNIKILQPAKIIEIKEEIKNINPDLILVIAYGQIIPDEILKIPKFGALNIHGSLLPKYRGAACVQAAILNGDKESGITIMQMEAGLDCGAIIHMEKYIISKVETSETLYNILSELGAKNLTTTLSKYLAGEIKPKKQNNCEASYIKKICKIDGKINWKKNAIEIERLIRAMTTWPGAYTIKNNKNIKIIKASAEIKKINNHKPGDFFIENRNLYAQCACDAIQILTIQPEGKKPMSAEMFMQGYKKYIG